MRKYVKILNRFHWGSLKRVLLRVLILAVIFLISLYSNKAGAEGTKQVRPDSIHPTQLFVVPAGGEYSCFATESCSPDQKLYVHITHPGEKIYLGFCAPEQNITFKITLNGAPIFTKTINFTGASPGYIKYYSQAVAGPKVLSPHGYNPVKFAPPQAGDYSIEFVVPPTDASLRLSLFDITVIDTTTIPLVAIEGRLWSKDWSFDTWNLLMPTNSFEGNLYVLSTDSIVTSIDFNNMQGWLFDVTSTVNGCYPPPFNWQNGRQSREGNHHYAEYKIFVSNPDSLEFPTGTLGMILGDTVNITQYCDGSMRFIFAVNKSGTIKLNIESDLAPGIQPEDLTMNFTVSQGIDTLYWDGKNAFGGKVPCGDSVAITMNFVNGLTNLALYDVERHPYGFIIQLVRPAGPPVATYWDDILLAAQGGETQLDGCYPALPDSGCHRWEGDVGSGIGSENTVNTWWYAASSVLDLGRFRIECVPHDPQGINGPITVCSSSAATYTVIPNPLIGSEPEGYEWVLKDVSSGAILFDSVNSGPSVKIHFSDFPFGPKRLKVRGRNKLCGVGSYGPVAGDTGILINEILSPEIINSQRTFTLCSYDTTDILLESSLPGSTFSYTATVTSPLITGQSGGNANPIRQVLVNMGSEYDTVCYHAVPYLSPCPGDTVLFIVIVAPADSAIFPVTVAGNPSCEGTPVGFTADTLLAGPAASYEWFVNGNPAGTNSYVFSYVPADRDLVQCKVISGIFCTPGNVEYSQVFLISVLQKVPVSVVITYSPDPLCSGDTVYFSATPQNGGQAPQYQWWVNGISMGAGLSDFSYVPANGDQVICMLTSDYFCVLNTEAYDTLQVNISEELKVIDTLLCYGTPYFAEGAWQTVPGIYHDTLNSPVSCVRYLETRLSYKPKVPVELGPDRVFCGDPIILDATLPGGIYVWQDSSANPVYQVTATGDYWVTVTYEGCSATDSVRILDCPAQLWFPDAFTPNGDGLNDTFHPKGFGVEKFSMKIFNRWGEMVFSTESLEPGWDGTCGSEPCPAGNYVYTAIYEGADGSKVQAKGTLSLIR